MSIKESLPDKCEKKFAEDLDKFHKIIDGLDLEEETRDEIMGSANRIFNLGHYLSVSNFYAEEMKEILRVWEPIVQRFEKTGTLKTTNPFDKTPVLAVNGIRRDKQEGQHDN